MIETINDEKRAYVRGTPLRRVEWSTCESPFGVIGPSIGKRRANGLMSRFRCFSLTRDHFYRRLCHLHCITYIVVAQTLFYSFCLFFALSHSTCITSCAIYWEPYLAESDNRRVKTKESLVGRESHEIVTHVRKAVSPIDTNTLYRNSYQVNLRAVISFSSFVVLLYFLHANINSVGDWSPSVFSHSRRSVAAHFMLPTSPGIYSDTIEVMAFADSTRASTALCRFEFDSFNF